MPFSRKTMLGIVIGISLIVSVASMTSLPLTNSESSTKANYQKSMKDFHASEEKMLDFIAQEKTELESKIGGEFKLP